MMTLARWRSYRRTDHLNLVFWHPRFRGQRDLGIKAFDQYIEDYHNSRNFFDRLAALAHIICEGAQYLVGMVDRRKQRAVNRLVAEAQQDLNQLTAPLPIDGNGTARTLAGYNQPGLAWKNIRVNVFLARQPLDEGDLLGFVMDIAEADILINQHILNANGVLNQGHMRVVRIGDTRVVTEYNGNPVLAPDMDWIPQRDVGSFSDHGRGVLTNYFNQVIHQNAVNEIDVVYVPRFQQALMAQGVTTRSNDPNRHPHCPFVVISEEAIDENTYGSTLVHELVHAVSGSGEHSSDPNNLMADGNVRNGQNQLTMGQIAGLRNSRYVV